MSEQKGLANDCFPHRSLAIYDPETDDYLGSVEIHWDRSPVTEFEECPPLPLKAMPRWRRLLGI